MRTEAQKKADKKYREKLKNNTKVSQFKRIYVYPETFSKINVKTKKLNISVVQFIKQLVDSAGD